MKLETIDDVLKLNTLCGIQDKAKANPQGKTMGLLVNRLTQCGIRDTVNAIISGGENIPDNEIWYWGEYYDMQLMINYLAESAQAPYVGPAIVSNELVDDKYVIMFDGPVTELGAILSDRIGQTLINPLFFAPVPEELIITKIALPKTVNTLGGYSFATTHLTAIENTENIDYVQSYGIYGCSSLTSLNIPNCTYIGDEALVNAGISSIILNDNLTYIGMGAFGRCSSLTTITVPNNVTAIGEHTFEGCASLDNVVLGTGVTHIYDNAFADCSSLSVLTFMANTVITPEGNIFHNIPENHITAIYVPDDLVDAYNNLKVWGYMQIISNGFKPLSEKPEPTTLPSPEPEPVQEQPSEPVAIIGDEITPHYYNYELTSAFSNLVLGDGNSVNAPIQLTYDMIAEGAKYGNDDNTLLAGTYNCEISEKSTPSGKGDGFAPVLRGYRCTLVDDTTKHIIISILNDNAYLNIDGDEPVEEKP